MSLALARLLPEFDPPATRHTSAAARNGKNGLSEVDPVLADALREEGRREGRQAATSELMARHAAELEKIHANHQADLEEQAAILVSQIAEAVPAAIAAREERLIGLLTDNIAKVLAPIVEDGIRAKMVAILVNEVRSALDLGQAKKITITGPDLWLDGMRAVLGTDTANLEFVHADAVDIDVVIDQTRLSSRFEILGETLREVMA